MVLFISFEVDSDAMGCACSKKAVVDDDPLPNLSAKVSRQSSARYLCASIQHNISQPLSGLLTAVKDNEEKVRVQYNHHHHYPQVDNNCNSNGMPTSSSSKAHKVKKGLWSPDEDEKLRLFITTHGHSACWSSIPKLAGHHS